MVPVGRRVAVIASSTKKSGAKIRRGSLGYIAKINRTLHIDKIQAVVTDAEIVFTRFGFESRTRREYKRVWLVHPTSNPNDLKKPQNYLDGLAKRVLDFSNTLTSSVDKRTVVVVHTSPTNILANENELLSWTLSVLSFIQPARLTIPEFANQNKIFEDLDKLMPAGKQLIDISMRSRKASISMGKMMFNDVNHFAPVFWAINSKIHLEMMKRLSDLNNGNLKRTLQYGNKYNVFYTGWYIRINNLPIRNLTDAKRLKERCKDIDSWIEIFNKLNSTIY